MKTVLRATSALALAVMANAPALAQQIAPEVDEAAPSEIDRLVFVASGAYTTLKQTRGRKLFILCRDDVGGV